MTTILIIIQIALAIALTVFILMQQTGTGFGTTWTGQSNYHTRRGIEKVVFYLTIIGVAIFGVVSLAIVIG